MNTNQINTYPLKNFWMDINVKKTFIEINDYIDGIKSRIWMKNE